MSSPSAAAKAKAPKSPKDSEDSEDPKERKSKIPTWVWALAGIVLLGSVRRRVDDATGVPPPSPGGPGPGRPTPAGGGEVPAVLTSANASQVASAIVVGLRAMGRRVTRQESWLYPLAVSCLETDVPPRAWRQMHNWNAGNVSAWDVRRQPWFTNPHVTEVHPFRSYMTLEAGARGMLDAMQGHGALDPADRGDLPGFQAAMTKYLANKDADGNVVPYPDLSTIVQKLRGTIVDNAT